jgi:hypothetical protein
LLGEVKEDEGYGYSLSEPSTNQYEMAGRIIELCILIFVFGK